MPPPAVESSAVTIELPKPSPADSDTAPATNGSAQDSVEVAGTKEIAQPATPAQKSEQLEKAEPTPPSEAPEAFSAPIGSWLDAQVELARRGFSAGSIDGTVGPKTRAALRAFQLSQSLFPSGELDEATHEILKLTNPAITQKALTVAELAALQPLEKTWLGKSQQSALAYETALEAVAEKFHAHPNFIKRLNPGIDWEKITEDTVFNVPAVDRVVIGRKAARAVIRLKECVFQAFDDSEKIIAHFPVSIGRLAESRPVGELRVTVVIEDPNYTFDPAVFPESAEARELGRKLILQPGPNNPVGVAWIGLNRSGYGIHGTPSPERVGSAESHGCFRLTNWDARTLLTLAWTGMPVEVLAGDHSE